MNQLLSWIFFFDMLFWQVLTVEKLDHTSVLISRITTTPFLPNNMLATKYSGLKLTVQLDSSPYISCIWRNSNGTLSSTIFFNPRDGDPGQPCGYQRSGPTYNVTCIKSNNTVTTTATFLPPLSHNEEFKVHCHPIPDLSDVVVASIFINVSDCFTSYPISVKSESASFNSVGKFTCDNGGTLFYANGTQLNSTETTCLATGQWRGQDDLKCLGGKLLPTIQTDPLLRDNKLATNFSGLVVTIKFVDEGYSKCAWIHGNKTISVFTGFDSCGNKTSLTVGLDNYAVSCVNKNNHISSSLTIPFAITTSDMGYFAFECNDSKTAERLFAVQDCSIGNGSFFLDVNYQSATYNSAGEFICSNSGVLMYSNGTRLYSAQTTCSASTQWSKQNILQCWTAPDVNIVGNFTVMVGDDKVVVNCFYYDEIPAGNKTKFQFGNKTFELTKGEPFFLPTLERSDNKKLVSCQAITPFTMLFPGTGYSKTTYLNVQYAPFVEEPFSCTWKINDTGSCKITFVANPSANIVSLTRNGLLLVRNHVFEVHEELHTFRFFTNQVTHDDNGSYILTVFSSVFGNQSISFDISVYTTSLQNVNAIIIAIATLLFVLVITVLSILIMRHKQVKQEEILNPSTNLQLAVESFNHNQVIVEEDNDGYIVPLNAIQTQTNQCEHVDLNDNSTTQGSAANSTQRHSTNIQNNYELETDEFGYLKLTSEPRESTSKTNVTINKHYENHLVPEYETIFLSQKSTSEREAYVDMAPVQAQ